MDRNTSTAQLAAYTETMGRNKTIEGSKQNKSKESTNQPINQSLYRDRDNNSSMAQLATWTEVQSASKKAISKRSEALDEDEYEMEGKSKFC